MLGLALVTYLVALPVLVLVVPPAVLLARRPRPAESLALCALAWLLLVAWVAQTYAGGVAADERDTGGTVFDTAAWLGAAVLAGLASVLVAVRGRRTPTGRR